MWIITVYAKDETRMFEYDTENQAREAFSKLKGCKVLSEVVYFNDARLRLSAV
ncbi:hypothetical protein LZP85_08145 [Priestia flexa]|jgi:hypothetical protein|uniref:Uncharacterized protein n=1 Tax=Priestia flexa TaxID=86664 RepID=A0A1N6VGV4_9BACI|nr:hypothetical protein [Priestia flexa]MBN8251362.1 hypothetical protein [Priestia flexa]MBN8434375.1 hypothetical protein [Priestia flexa]MBY6086375.1 hypothetical protein [Priestia flexa]MCA0966841.1 hypothetical protein [Priestia flexa]UIR31738.1 hypothetical protein LZP85_08145 [Priestia flexa]